MLGRRSPQVGMFQADHLYLEHVGRDSFYGFFASHRGEIFRDDDFAALYCSSNGRNSVPPSLLATALLLQTHDRASDEEATARANFDLRWKVALGVGVEDRPFAKSTLQLFRAQLILHDTMREVFRKSLAFARQTGYLKGRKIKVVLDTSHILGRGAVKDTYNLLADGITELVEVLASHSGDEAEVWAKAKGLARYYGSSIKKDARIRWDDPQARRGFLASIVADADRLLEEARQSLDRTPQGSDEEQRIRSAADLLGRLLLQDVERRPDGAALRDGVAPDRIVSVHDPEMRHGRKSKKRRFDGHKAAVAVDPESQLITAAAVLPGNAPDRDQAMELVKQTEENAQVEVEETVGDCAYGDGETRQAFADAGRELVARVPSGGNRGYYPKEDFAIDLEVMTCCCPAGHVCTTVRRGKQKGRDGRVQARLTFEFEPDVCGHCAVRTLCVAARPGKGRSVSVHPQERLLQEARALQESAGYAPYPKMRQVVEHRLARLVQLGMRKARYFGRQKALFQLLLASTLANLTLVAVSKGLMKRQRTSRSRCSFCDSTLGTVFHTLFARVFARRPHPQGVFG